MVPLDRALLSSYRLCIVTIPLSVNVWPQFAMQILTGVPTPKSFLPVGDRSRLIQCYLGQREWHVIPSNGLSRVHECDRQPARQTGIQRDIRTMRCAVTSDAIRPKNFLFPETWPKNRVGRSDFFKSDNGAKLR